MDPLIEAVSKYKAGNLKQKSYRQVGLVYCETLGESSVNEASKMKKKTDTDGEV